MPVRTQVEAGALLIVYIGGDDGCEHGLELHYGTPVDALKE